MKKSAFAILLLLTNTIAACQGQTGSTKKMNLDTNQNNPLICDPIAGICGVADMQEHNQTNTTSNEKPLKLLYFTDPICSSCWGIEPQLRKLKLEYGDSIDIEYRMGGLLPDWSYNSGGISKPSDVAHHWDEVSMYYDMPIDGDIWLEDPLPSSYPPSIAFKAAQMQDPQKAVLFLRLLREMVFLQKKNICKWRYLQEAAMLLGLDVQRLKSDYDGKARQLFETDLQMAKSLGVRGFPTLFFLDNKGKREVVYGSKPYAILESSINKLLPAVSKTNYEKTFDALFTRFNSLTLREYSELSGIPRAVCEQLLNTETERGRLKKETTKNGSIWRR